MKRKALALTLGFTLVEPFGFAHGKLPVVRKGETKGFTLVELPVVRKGETKGFTLVELLVVIAIIVLLVAIIAPSFSSAIAMGRATTCRNNLQKLGQAFSLSSTSRAQKGSVPIMGGGVGDVYPEGDTWPSIPRDAVPTDEIYACPEDEVVETLAGSLADLEYESPFGTFPLDGPGTEETCFKKRRGTGPDGGYTEFIFQDDYDPVPGSQYKNMSFNGWVDTDGGMRIYDSGLILVFENIEQESVGCVPDWSGAHTGYPTGINTCPNMNNMLYKGAGAFNGTSALQGNRGQSFQLPDWGVGTNYGINSYAYKASFGSTIIVLVDYTDTMVDVDWPSDVQDALVDSARHPGNKVNYLRANGSVTTTTPMEISPLVEIEKWK